MANNERIVAIDTDFFEKLTEKDKDGRLFLKIMDEFGAKPVMHEYVFNYELAHSSTAKMLKTAGKIEVYDYARYIKPENKENYINNFKMAFGEFNYEEFDEQKDIFQYHHQKQNLGEIRTALMAFYMGIDLFMSDDGQAKQFTMNKLSSRSHRITVYNIYDMLVELHKLENCSIKWADVKGMAKYAFDEARDKYDRINKIWHELEE